MNFLVVVSFDLQNATSPDYVAVASRLASVGLRHQLVGTDGSTQVLPSTTYAGTFAGVTAGEVRDSVVGTVATAFKACGVSARFFVFVGDNWAWSCDNTSPRKFATAAPLGRRW